jgi:hypothetical protein
MHLSFGLAKWFGFCHVMRRYTWDPSPEVSYSALWLDIFVVQHLTIVINYWHSKSHILTFLSKLPSKSITWSINLYHFTIHCNHRSLPIPPSITLSISLPLECFIPRSEYRFNHCRSQPVPLGLIHTLRFFLPSHLLLVSHLIPKLHITLLVVVTPLHIFLLFPLCNDLIQ